MPLLRERSITLDELGDPDAPIGSRPWSLWLANEIRKTLYDNQQTGTRLRYLVDTFKEHAGWQELGFLTWEEFCAKRLQTEAEKIESEVKLRENGGDRRSASFQYSNQNTEKIRPGENAEYLKARLARDEPEILERYKAGEFRSVRAAAIEAGIVNVKTRYSLPDDPQAAGRYLAQRVDREWFDSLIDAYYKAIEG